MANRPAGPTPADPGGLLWAAAIFGLAAALRLYALGDTFPVDDEFMQFFEALHPGGFAGFLKVTGQNPHHLLLDALSTFLVSHLGSSLWWLRLPSVFWGVLAVGGVWRLAASLEGEARGRLAALLLAVSLLHVDWSRRCDFYALLTALSVFSTLAFFRLLEDPRRWGWYGFWAVLFIYGHPYFVLVAAFHGAFLLAETPAARRAEVLRGFLPAWGLAGLLFIPWFLYSSSTLLDRRLFDFDWIAGTMTLKQFLARLPLYAGQAPEVGPMRQWRFSIPSLASAAYLALYAVSLVAFLRRGAGRLVGFAHLLLPFALLTVTALDLHYHYFFSPRQLLWALPFYLLLVADGTLLCVGRLGPRFQANAVRGLAAGFTALALPGCWDAVSFQKARMQDQAAIVENVARHVRPGDVLGFEGDGILASFLWFYDKEAFRRCDDLRLIEGHITFLVSPGLRARRGAADNSVRLLGRRKDRHDRPEGLWLFRGSLYDLSVYPPVRGGTASPVSSGLRGR